MAVTEPTPVKLTSVESLEERARKIPGPSGRTVLFVSHSMGSVAELCSSAILLDRGAVVRAGAVPDVVDAYLNLLNLGRQQGDFVHLDDPDCTIFSIGIRGAGGKPSRTFDLAEPITIELRYRLHRQLFGFQISLSLSRNLTEVLRTFDTDGGEAMQRRMPGEYVSRHVLPGRFLKAGSYSVSISAGTPEREMINTENAAAFEIEEVSENTRHRGYFGSRPGHVISPGKWVTERMGETAQRPAGRSTA